MQITDETVDKIAELAKLKFEGEKKQEIKKDLNKVLDFVEKINELDTEGIEPLIHISDEINVLRADVSENNTTQQEALKNAPKKDNYYFKIPKVIQD